MLRVRLWSAEEQEEEEEAGNRRQRRRVQQASEGTTASNGGLRSWALELYARGRLSARDVTTLAQLLQPHAHLHGVADLALAPWTSGGHRQGGRATRVVEQAVGQATFVEERIFWAEVPMFRKKMAGELLYGFPSCCHTKQSTTTLLLAM